MRCWVGAGWWWCPMRWCVPRKSLHALLVGEQVGVLSQTPSAFYALQAADGLAPEVGDQLTLQTVVFGGEALQPQRLGVAGPSSGVTAAAQYVWHYRDHGACLGA